ncbi:MAG: transposase [Sedimentisphaerales bacterium]|jgi:putative transposase
MVDVTLESAPVACLRPTAEEPQALCLDTTYDLHEVRALVEGSAYTAHICSRGEETQAIKHQAGFKTRRGVAERTHSWMNCFLRILIRWEKKPKNYLGFFHFICAIVMFRRTELFG